MTNIDPRTKHPRPPYNEHKQASQPGSSRDMGIAPDHGEDSYTGAERLVGKRALITGGDSGIGRAVAIAYAREGADVAIAFLPEERSDARETQRLVEASGRRCVLLPGDLTEESACIAAVGETVDALGGLDVLVLNAATQRERADDAAIDRQDALRVFETNLVAPLLLFREAAQYLEPGASVIVTASVQAFDPSPDLLDYAMTKAALVAFVEALAQQQGEKGVRANAVAPGPIWTPLIPATGWDDKLRDFGSTTPLGRAGQPAELAGAYVYLASEDASYTSGSVIAVTGGRHL
ncbi:SDR family oxidoreductase [Microbacterium indicum]|uniref:SDR family oxidoreductase n=1 Tax=Microbacterium indicum TaxID=358100 RepID=UPI00048A9591|nr:SDR family oxidoreductase [Microbacterium indicum]